MDAWRPGKPSTSSVDLDRECLWQWRIYQVNSSCRKWAKTHRKNVPKRKCAKRPRLSLSSFEVLCPCNTIMSANLVRLKYRFVCCFWSFASPPFFRISLSESDWTYSCRDFNLQVAFGGAGEPVPGEGVRGGKSVLIFVVEASDCFTKCLTKYFFDLEL